MDIEYLIKLWKLSNLDTILIKDLPLARGTDNVIVEPTLIYHEPEINYDDMIQSLTENVVIQTTQKVDFELKQAGQVVYKMPED